MSKPAISALYFVLTFVAGAAVGSWALWIYLMGFPQGAENPPAAAPAAEVSAPAPQPLPSPPPRIGTQTEKLEPDEPVAAPSHAADEDKSAAPTADLQPTTPTPKGHWNKIDIPGRSHEECLAQHQKLDDAYKDCRFGVHKQEWVPE